MLFRSLLGKGTLSAAVTKKVFADKAVRAVLEEWQKKGLVEVVDILEREIVSEKRELCYRQTGDVDLPDTIEGDIGKEQLKTASCQEVKGKKLGVPLLRTLFVLKALAQKQRQEIVAASDIRKVYSGASKALQELEKRGLIEGQQRKIGRAHV